LLARVVAACRRHAALVAAQHLAAVLEPLAVGVVHQVVLPQLQEHEEEAGRHGQAHEGVQDARPDAAAAQ
ncbi:hypothetical protein FE64_15200, partial [Staphylococcus aureus]